MVEYGLTGAAGYTVFCITDAAVSNVGVGLLVKTACGANDEFGTHCDGRYIPGKHPVPVRLGQPVPLMSSASAHSGGMSMRLDSA